MYVDYVRHLSYFDKSAAKLPLLIKLTKYSTKKLNKKFPT